MKHLWRSCNSFRLTEMIVFSHIAYFIHFNLKHFYVLRFFFRCLCEMFKFLLISCDFLLIISKSVDKNAKLKRNIAEFNDKIHAYNERKKRAYRRKISGRFSDKEKQRSDLTEGGDRDTEREREREKKQEMLTSMV